MIRQVSTLWVSLKRLKTHLYNSPKLKQSKVESSLWVKHDGFPNFCIKHTNIKDAQERQSNFITYTFI